MARLSEKILNPKNTILIDTTAWIGLINVRNYLAPSTRSLMSQLRGNGCRFVTTTPILLEVLDGLSTRERFLSRLLRSSLVALNCEVIALEEALFDQVWKFFEARPDKEWALTDCFSFVVMQERGISQSLTYDHHFEQAGFRALLRQN